ncbi:MAG: rod shape-determining protein [Eubacteriales bacterium]|nr:rod shape-determining protein [Eubacteriales bacterium]
MFGSDIGIDLGTSSVLIYIKGKGIVLEEPSVVAIEKSDNTVIAVGEKAKKMIGKAPSNINVIRPLKDGVISNYSITEIMLKYFINKSIGKQSSRRPKIAICVPSQVTEVEKKAVKDATKDAGAREVFVIEEPVAAAIGSGIDISRACGSMVVDIGAGTTDVAVISLGGSVAKASVRVAGDHFDSAIIKYIKKKYNIIVGEKTAEKAKIEIGTAYKDSAFAQIDVRGRNIVTGLPSTVTITSNDLYEALLEPIDSILATIKGILEITPPELSADIYERGIVMTGGGSLLYGFDKLIKEKTGINTVVAEDAITCVALGTGKYVEYNSKLNKQNKKFKISNFFRFLKK